MMKTARQRVVVAKENFMLAVESLERKNEEEKLEVNFM
jgi:hypothetical protein